MPSCEGVGFILVQITLSIPPKTITFAFIHIIHYIILNYFLYEILLVHNVRRSDQRPGPSSLPWSWRLGTLIHLRGTESCLCVTCFFAFTQWKLNETFLYILILLKNPIIIFRRQAQDHIVENKFFYKEGFTCFYSQWIEGPSIKEKMAKPILWIYSIVFTVFFISEPTNS